MANRQNAVRDLGPRRGARGTFDPPYYTIASGDNLENIAKRFGVKVKAIQNANDIRNPNRIRADDRIIIPGAEIPVDRSTYLKVGQLAYVRFGQDGSQMRADPVVTAHNPDANVVGWIPSGYVVKIVGGPVRDQNHYWWQVQSPLLNGGRKAWAAGRIRGHKPPLIPFDPRKDKRLRIVQVSKEQ